MNIYGKKDRRGMKLPQVNAFLKESTSIHIFQHYSLTVAFQESNILLVPPLIPTNIVQNNF